MNKAAEICFCVATVIPLAGCLFGGGQAESPSVNSVQTVQNETTVTKDKATTKLIANDVAKIHDTANNLVGWGRDAALKDKSDSGWMSFNHGAYNEIMSEVTDALKAIGTNVHTDSDNQLKRDLQNIQKLDGIAHTKHDVTALIDIHRIASDLQDFGLNLHYNGSGGEDGYYGYTNMLKGAKVQEVEKYIQQNS